MGFGRYIRSKREAEGMQMKELCKRLDISMAYWSRIERDMEYPPKDDLIQRAAEVLNLPLDEAFTQAQRLPPDLRGAMPAVVAAYRRMQRRQDDGTN